MSKNFHEFRDPIHVFIKASSYERNIIDTPAFQRLRNIHQLALTYLVYPGATHRRFEHSLGVMEIASRIFDVVTRSENVTDELRNRFPALRDDKRLDYWRSVVRIAGLCHDLGHLPFSHAAEKELLPGGVTHEILSAKLIRDAEIRSILESGEPPINVEHVVKLAVGTEHAKKLDPPVKLNAWEQVLSEIIVGDAFGADRIDYLLRDSYHTGVAYGRFDHYRLIDTLRILPPSPSGLSDGEGQELKIRVDSGSKEPQLGVEEGGLQTAESLVLARYFMFSQLYLHWVRRVYDIHLKDFLKEWLPHEQYPVDIEEHLSYTDNEVLSALREKKGAESDPCAIHAKRILSRGHFRRVWERNPLDIKVNRDAGELMYEALSNEFGAESVRRDFYEPKAETLDFPVKFYNDEVVSSLALSDILRKVPRFTVDLVFMEKSKLEEAKVWLKDHKRDIIKPAEEEGDG